MEMSARCPVRTSCPPMISGISTRSEAIASSFFLSVSRSALPGRYSRTGSLVGWGTWKKPLAMEPASLCVGNERATARELPIVERLQAGASGTGLSAFVRFLELARELGLFRLQLERPAVALDGLRRSLPHHLRVAEQRESLGGLALPLDEAREHLLGSARVLLRQEDAGQPQGDLEVLVVH